MMRHQGLIVTARHLSSDRGLTFGSDGLPLVGVVFFPSSSLVGLCCSLTTPIDETV